MKRLESAAFLEKLTTAAAAATGELADAKAFRTTLDLLDTPVTLTV